MLEKKNKRRAVAKKKSAAKFNSHSTPGHQMELSAWLVELAMTRQNQGVKLPERFWTDSRWKFRFGREIQAVRKFIKEFSEPAILKISLKNYITTYTDYAQMQFLLQKIKESVARLALPKDTSDVAPESIPEGPDLRDYKIDIKKKKGLFERLEEIKNGS